MSVSVDTEKCVGCGICVSLCPLQAISIIENKAYIDQNRCNECLQCISECPSKAIYQISEKEISATERQDSTPSSVRGVSPQSSQGMGSYSYERKQRILNGSGRLLDRIRDAANSFFQDNSSFGRGKKGRGRRYGGRGRGYRGGRFKR